MRKIIFLLGFFMLSVHTPIYSQTIVRSDPDAYENVTFTVDISHTDLGPIASPNSLRQRGVKTTLPFIEFGDGGFSTEGVSVHKLCRSNYSTVLFAASTYDTTKPYSTRIALASNTLSSSGANLSSAYSTTTHFSTNDQPVLPANKNIFITSNVNEIVPGDYNNFAITYKIPDDTSALVSEYKVVFYYNSNAIFNSINSSEQINSDGNASMVRLFYGDHIANDGADNNEQTVMLSNEQINFTGSLTILCGTKTTTERNIFVTTVTDPSVKLNDETSICAVLLKSTNGGPWEKIDDYFINNMPVAEAHDPNYIVQTGQCLLLPRTSKRISYHVHFQNDGQGKAGKVDIDVQLPKGINNNNISFGKANCGGHPFTFSAANTQYDSEHCRLSFTFDKGEFPVLLYGTDNNIHPFNNPNTMGDIFFSVEESVITTDTLPAVAEIYFYNEGSITRLPVVRTNLALSVYRIKCEPGILKIGMDTASYWGNSKNNRNTCPIFLGICWYWWLLLIIPIGALFYWVYYKRRKNNAA